jgi:hypothetical protein
VVNTNDEKITEVVLFPENNSSKVLKDYQDNYWFASLNNGVQIVPNLVDRMYHVQPFLTRTFSLTSKPTMQPGTNLQWYTWVILSVFVILSLKVILKLSRWVSHGLCDALSRK